MLCAPPSRLESHLPTARQFGISQSDVRKDRDVKRPVVCILIGFSSGFGPITPVCTLCKPCEDTRTAPGSRPAASRHSCLRCGCTKRTERDGLESLTLTRLMMRKTRTLRRDSDRSAVDRTFCPYIDRH